MEATKTAPDTESPEATLDPAFVEGFWRPWLRAWNDHDVDALLAPCSDEITWRDPAVPEVLYGHRGGRYLLGEVLFDCVPDLRLEEVAPPHLSPVAPKVLLPYRLSGTMLGPWEPLGLAPSGADIDFYGVDHWEFRDGQLCRWQTLYDLGELLRQMRVLPPNRSRAERGLMRLQNVLAWFQRRGL